MIEARKQHGWSQLTVADRIGTTQHNVSRWEQGHTRPGPFFLTKLCKLYGKQPHELGLRSQSVDKEQQALLSPPSSLSPFNQAPEMSFPLQLVDIPRNPFFTGREEILHYLHEYFMVTPGKASKQPLVLCGLEGCGKTQIALEFFYQHQHAYPFIFWINATTNDTLLDSLDTIVHQLRLPYAEGGEYNKAFLAVKQWLKAHQRWLLIIDNVNDLSVLHEFAHIEYSGHLLLTSRNYIPDSLMQKIEIPSMGMAEATHFLLRRSRLIAPNATLEQAPLEMIETAEQIVTALHFFSMGVDQAGAMVEHVGCSLLEYREMYQQHRLELLHYYGQAYTSHPASVAQIWLHSFRQIEQTNPAAAALLRLFAFLEPNAIPEELISAGYICFSPILQESGWDMFVFNNAIKDLRTFSLIQRDNKEHLLRIHPLLQAVLKDSMEREEQQIVAEGVIHAINKLFPEKIEPTSWLLCQRYLPQAQICVTWIQEYRFIFEAAASLLLRVACYLHEIELYEQAEQLMLLTKNLCVL